MTTLHLVALAHLVAAGLRRLAIILGLGLVATVALSLAVWSLRTVSDEAFERTTTRADVFEYVEVSYVGREGPTLGMQSTRAWLMPIDRVVWNDVLKCETASGGRWAVWSTADTSAAHVDPAGLEVVPWNYTASFPDDGRMCRVEATVSAEVRGRVFSQRIVSDSFSP